MADLRAGFWLATPVSGRDGRFRVPGVGRFAAEVLVESDQHYVVRVTLRDGEVIQGRFVCRGAPFGPATGIAVSDFAMAGTAGGAPGMFTPPHDRGRRRERQRLQAP